MSSSNTELLNWAVENVKEWDLLYDLLFADKTIKVFYGCETDNWDYSQNGHWTSYNSRWHYAKNHLGKLLEFAPTYPQVITKQEWLDAKQEKETMTNMIERNKVYDLKVTGEQLALIFF